MYDVQRVPQLYERVYERAGKAARAEDTLTNPHRQPVSSQPGAGAFLSARSTPSNSPNARDAVADDWLLGESHVSNVPLGVGDALLLKQVEIHRTDPVVREGQYRLALGLKLLERVPLVQEPPRGTRLGRRLEQLRGQWPGVLQRPARGSPFPNWYAAVGLARNLSAVRW